MKKPLLILLAMLILLAGVPLCVGASSASLPYEISWLSSAHSAPNTGTPLLVNEITGDVSTVDSLQVMTVEPGKNFPTSHVMQLNFTFGDNMNVDVEAGAVKIILPKSIFFKPDGTSVDIQPKLPLAYNSPTGTTAFTYYFEGDNIVIYNYKAFSEALMFSTMVEYSALPSTVPTPYTSPVIEARVEVTRFGLPTQIYESNNLQLKYDTSSRLDEARKSAAAAVWQDSWGPKPADADDYFYVRWNVFQYYPGTNTEPYYITVDDIPREPEAEIVRWELYKLGPNNTAYNMDLSLGKDANWALFDQQMTKITRVETPSTTFGDYQYVFFMRYPKSLLVFDPVTKIYSVTVQNTYKGTLTGDYGSTDTKESTSAFTYTEKLWLPPPGASDLNKTALSSSPGMMNKLEDAYAAGSTAALPLTGGVSDYNFDIISRFTDYARTQDANGQYGVLPWTVYHRDSYLSMNAVNGSLAVPLQAGDYEITQVRFQRPFEQTYGPPTPMGTAPQIRTPYSDYGTTQLQITKVTGATDADFTTIGTVDVRDDGYFNYTPLGGTPGNYVYLSGKIAVALPPGTLGVRFMHTFNGAYVEQKYEIKVSLFPTERVVTSLKNPPEYTVTRDTAQLFNVANVQAKGGALNDSSVFSRHAYTMLSRYNGGSALRKSVTHLRADNTLGAEVFNVTLSQQDQLQIDAALTIPEAAALGYLTEQEKGAFYDLLPIGTTVDPATIVTRRFNSTSPPAGDVVPHTFEFIENFRGSLRTLLIIRPYLPEGAADNFAKITDAPNWLFSGFTATFELTNSWQNHIDNGYQVVNYAAYESTEGPLWLGKPDQAPADWPANIQAPYNNINCVPEEDDKRFLYAKAEFGTIPLMSVEMGFDKMVKAPEDLVFSKETVVQGSGSYIYQLRFSTRPDSNAGSLIFYDAIEDRGPMMADPALAEPRFWLGSFEGFDFSFARTVWGLEPKAYYAAIEVNPKADRSQQLVNPDGSINTAIWTPMPSDGSIPDNLQSIAVDLRYLPDGTPFILGPQQSVLVNLKMRAPNDVAPYTAPNETRYAWNNAYVGAESPVGLIFASVEDVPPTKVSLKPIDLVLDKTSTPPSSTQEDPATVFVDGALDYTLSLLNQNTMETIPGIVLEDTIPDGLVFDPLQIRYAFGDAAYAPLAGATRVSLTVTGQKLDFHIDKLAPGERVRFLIPTVVDQPGETSPTVFENIAYVREAFGYEQYIETPPTWHETVKVSVSLPSSKILDAGGRTLTSNEFTAQLYDETGLALGDPVKNDAEGRFVFPDLWFGKPGDFRYTLREVPGNEGGMDYSALEYSLLVTVTYDAATDSLTAVPVLTLSGAPADAAVFTNTYTANGEYTPEIRKTLRNLELQDGMFTAVLQGEGMDEQSVTNTNGAFTFATLLFDENDIGKTYTYTIIELPEGPQGVVNDRKTITLTLTISDLKNGELRVAAAYTDTDTLAGNNQVFANEHPAPEPPVVSYPTLKVPLTAQKVFKGAPLKAGQFSFELLDSTGRVLEKVTNGADGSVVFTPRTFSRVVTNYLYTIREVKGNDETIVYNPTIYTVKVTTRDEGGALTAKVSYESDKGTLSLPVFTNTKKAPKTGDQALAAPLILLSLALPLLLLSVSAKRRKE